MGNREIRILESVSCLLNVILPLSEEFPVFCSESDRVLSLLISVGTGSALVFILIPGQFLLKKKNKHLMSLGGKAVLLFPSCPPTFY